MAKNKFGPYIQKLMTTVLDKEQDEFVRNLAGDELKRLNINIEEILHQYENECVDVEVKEKLNKQLLQEDKKNVTDK